MMTEKFNIGVHRKIRFLGDGVGGGGEVLLVWVFF